MSFPAAAVTGLFLLLLLVAPLPVGANRDWAWSPMVAAIGVIAALCAAFGGSRGFAVAVAERRPMLLLLGTFVFFLLIALIQMSPLAPATPSAGIYAKARQILGQAHAAVPALAIDASYDALLRCLGCALFFLVARTLCNDERSARQLMWVLLISALIVAAYGMYMQVTTHNCYVGTILKKAGEYKPAMDRCLMSGTFVGSNNFACYLGMAVVSALALLFGRPPERRRHDEYGEDEDAGVSWLTGANLALAAVAVLCMGGILISGSRAGFGATVAGMAALGYLLIRGENFGKSLWRIAALSTVALLVVGVIAGSSLLRKFVASSDALNRPVIWTVAIDAVRESPMLGWGMGSFYDVWALHQPATMLQPNDKAHSTPLETLVEMGIPGGIAAMFLVVIPWGICLRGALRQSRRRRYLPATAFAIATVPILHSTIDFSLQIPAIAFMASAFLGLGWAHSFPQDAEGDEGFTNST